jgi:plasmid maintenance system antidote protein VapI
LQPFEYFGITAKFWLGLQEDSDIEACENIFAEELTEIPEMNRDMGLRLDADA